MRRIRDKGENETLENAIDAFEGYSRHKRSRDYVLQYEKDLLSNLEKVIKEIRDETWESKGYTPKTIFEKKYRTLAKAPIEDHVTEAAAIRPYEKRIYDFSTWRAPAVKPGLGTHGLFRFLRNEIYKNDYEDMKYDVTMDAHHYFPLMDHEILKRELCLLIKPGKLRMFLFKVVDSYLQGSPLGIKIAQLFGQIYLARFDRLAIRFFDILKDPDKMAYWTTRYVTDRICTARTPQDMEELSKGPAFLAEKFRRYVKQGIKFYYRFVDNIVILHADKTVLHIIIELSIMTLSREWHVSINPDHNVRLLADGIRLCGYTFYPDCVKSSKHNKKELAKKVTRLRKIGYNEEQIRIKLASRFGYVKHANVIHLFKKLGMEKSLGKIIKNRRVKPPFDGMNASQKVKFSTLVNKCETGGGIFKLLLEDFKIIDSKIDNTIVKVEIENSVGGKEFVEKTKPNKALAIRFKRILTTSISDGEEIYTFEKKKDEEGRPTSEDAEYYSFTGSKILIDQATNDFSLEDLPCPTIIQQFRTKTGQTFVKFT